MTERTSVNPDETTPAQERGERIETGKDIARGGKQAGHVPGAEPHHGAAADRSAVEKAKAVREAMALIGDEADPEDLARRVRASTGLNLTAEEVAAIRAGVQSGPADRSR
jgi:hypothetical protein